VTIKFLLDEHLPKTLFRELTAAGVDAIRVHDVGLRGASDERILSFAAMDERILVSRDKKTMKDLAEARLVRGEKFPGLLMVRPGLDLSKEGRGIGILLKELSLIAGATEPSEWAGLVEYVPFLYG